MGSRLVLPTPRAEEPEVILYNGTIWTVDDPQPYAQTMAISTGRFVAVGSNEDVLRLATLRTRKVDLTRSSAIFSSQTADLLFNSKDGSEPGQMHSRTD